MRDEPFARLGVVTLFPTIAWRVQLAPEVHARVSAAVIQELDRLGDPLRRLPQGHSWQSEHTLHERPALQEFVAAIRRASAGVIEFLRIGHEGFEITGCWANVNTPGAHHPLHRHPNNFLSGVYYLRVAEGANTIEFHDPRPQAGVVRPPVRELTAENTDMAVVRVEPGTLLLFPAWLEHSVPANRSAEPRVSMSFNVMFSRYVESMARPLWEPGDRGPG